MNNPRVTLLSITHDIPRVMSKVWQIAKDKQSLEDMEDLSPKEIEDIIGTNLPTAEYINTIWCVEGMPRAFWDQFDRTRLAAFWEQSVRILDLSTFYDDMGYWIPDSIANVPEALDCYNKGMKHIQETYSTLVKNGVPSEDARGVIPLHVNVRGTCAINLRALKGVISNRVCFISQGAYWLPVISGMIRELNKVLPERVVKSMVNLPCRGKDHCPIESNVVTRLTDEDPNPICPIYMKRFMDKTDQIDLDERTISTINYIYEKHPNYDEIKDKYFELIRSLGMEE